MAELSFEKYHEYTAGPSAPGVVRSVCDIFAPESVVEVGCFSAVYLEHFARFGVDVAATRFHLEAPILDAGDDPRIVAHDLLKPNPFGFSFDVAMSLEVADKLQPAQADLFVQELCSYSDIVVFSAASPGQGGAHANSQPLEYWIDRFRGHGYLLDVRRTLGLRNQWTEVSAPEWLQNNVAVFSRCEAVVNSLDAASQIAGRIDGFLGLPALSLLFNCARAVPREQTIVDVGCFKGRATVAMALGARAGQGAMVHAIDHHRGDPESAKHLGIPLNELRTWREFRANLLGSRVDAGVVPHLEDSLAAAAAWNGTTIGMLLLDGDREPDGLSVEMSAWWSHAAPGTLIIFDATRASDGFEAMIRQAREASQLGRGIRVGGLFIGMVPERSDARVPTSPTHRKRYDSRRDRISIIIPTRNEGDYLKATIDSLLENTFYPDFEVLVMDDASSDGSTDFLLNPGYYRDGRLILIRKPSQVGYLPLWLEGVHRASGSILKVLDSHHCFEPFWLTNLYEQLKRRNFDAIVGPAVCGIDPEAWTLKPGTALIGYTFDTDFTRIRCLTDGDMGNDCRVPWLCGHQMMMTRSLYEEVGGFFPYFVGHGTDDSDLCMRAFLLGYECFVEPSSVIGHYHKTRHMNKVTYDDIAMNILMSVFLNLGRERFQAFVKAHREDLGFAEGTERMEKRRAELEYFRDWIARRQRRTPEELLENLAHY